VKVRMGTLRWRHPAAVIYLGFSSKQKQIVTLCADRFIRVWDLATGKEVRRFGGPELGKFEVGNSSGPYARIALSPDGMLVAASESANKIALWEVSSGKKLRSLGRDKNTGSVPYPMGMEGLAFSPDSKMLAVRSRETITFWDVASGREIRRMGKL